MLNAQLARTQMKKKTQTRTFISVDFNGKELPENQVPIEFERRASFNNKPIFSSLSSILYAVVQQRFFIWHIFCFLSCGSGKLGRQLHTAYRNMHQK